MTSFSQLGYSLKNNLFMHSANSGHVIFNESHGTSSTSVIRVKISYLEFFSDTKNLFHQNFTTFITDAGFHENSIELLGYPFMYECFFSNKLVPFINKTCILSMFIYSIYVHPYVNMVISLLTHSLTHNFLTQFVVFPFIFSSTSATYNLTK